MTQDIYPNNQTDYPSREAVADAIADKAAKALQRDIEGKGSASLLCSGGSTPSAFFTALAAKDLAWEKVRIGLVDDRFVPPDHPASNEGLIRRTLLRGAAEKAAFIPLWKTGVSAEIAAQAASEVYAALLPASFILLGMGNDGHTASWFPGARNLKGALDPAADSIVAIDATGCPVAGDFVTRLTLSKPALDGTQCAILLIHGVDKKEALQTAMTKNTETAPIRAAMTALGDCLKIAWAP